MSTAVLQLRDVKKKYLMGDQEIHALRGIDLEIHAGEFVAIMGPSGSGKSTLLHMASLLDTPSSGQVLLEGKEVSQYTEPQLARVRNKAIGFVFQQFNLLPKTTALENVALPLIYANVPYEERVQRSTAILQRVGLGERLGNTRAQMSGGQQQRVAIARALVTEPSLIFADEPTGNLDSKSGDEIMHLFLELHQEGKTIVMVTHEEDVAAFAERIVRVKDGKVLSDKKQKQKKSPLV